MAKDAMLTVLYDECFAARRRADAPTDDKEKTDRLRQVAIAENALLSKLIDIRTDQIRQGQA